MNFAFAGTPVFAAWVLADMVALGRVPTLVISQPDRPRGRGRRASKPPAVHEAERLGLESFQTEDINSSAAASCLEQARASTLVVAAFGQMLRPSLLDSRLCLNVHASLLPAYRGAAPIERAIAAGESSTGVSIVRMETGLDEGPIALQSSISVGLRHDAGSLARILAMMGAIGMDQVLTGLAEGTISWVAQEGVPTYAPKLTVEEFDLDPSGEARAVHDQVRSLSPGIGARCLCGSVELKVWRSWPFGQPGLQPTPAGGVAVAERPGFVLAGEGRLFVGCARGVLELLEVQPQGKARMHTADFLRGYSARLGERLEPRKAPSGTEERGDEADMRIRRNTHADP